MINPTFYTDKNTVKQYFKGKTTHYALKELVTVVGTYDYVLKFGENMYTLAIDLFGADKEHFWTILAEINELREPDDWEAEEVVKLPKIVVNELREDKTIFTNVRTDTTSIPTIR